MTEELRPPDPKPGDSMESAPVKPSGAAEDAAQETKQLRRRTRLRRFFLRHLPFSVAGLVALLALILVGAYFYMSTESFENFVRGRLIASIERMTGGRVEIGSFRWHLLDLEADVDNVVIHGLEGPGEAPYARIGHLRVDFSVLGVLSPRLLLTELTVTQPQIHLIVYRDGSTNQPHPRRERKPGKPVLDELFDFHAGRVAFVNGVLDYDNRASSFDAQNRKAPLDFTASDVSLLLRDVPAQGREPESFHVEAGATDLSLARTAPKISKANTETSPVHAQFRAVLEIERNAATLTSLRIAARGPDNNQRALEVTGTLQDFSSPAWQSRIAGDLDMRLLEPVTGYPNAPEGIAHLDLTAAGHDGEFRIDGPVHVDNAAYVGTGVDEHGIGLDARVHADQGRLLIDNIVARLHQGGRIEGIVDLAHWLPRPPQTAEFTASAPRTSKSSGKHTAPPPHAAPRPVQDITIPVDGKVTANFKDVSLDTILDMVSQPPFQRVGLDTLVNGTAIATWVKGEDRTVAVDAKLGLTQPARPAPSPQEAPASGVIDATYTQSDGSVDVRRLELHLPQSDIEARGQLGAYPLTSPTALMVGFHTRNFAEFDTILRSLGLRREGKTGAAALPVSLAGQADFDGSWAGSLVHPRLAGHVKGEQLDIEMPPAANAPGQPRYVHVDSLEADGNYAAQRIAVLHATAERGKTNIVFNGTLDSSDPGETVFDENSVIHLHAQATSLSMDDVQPFLVKTLPVTGTLDAQIQAEGPAGNLSGSGWVQLENGAVYDEPITRFRAEGSLNDKLVKLTEVSLGAEGGAITGSGSYDLHSGVFQAEAHGSGIDIARIAMLRRQDLDVAGKLDLSLNGSGTFDDPRIESHASVTGLELGGERIGGLEFAAHTAGERLNYEVTTSLEGAQLSMHGQTVLRGDYGTQAQLNFSRFDIGALLRLAHVQAITGESSLAGTMTIAGPLRYPERMIGDARLEDLAVTVAGVRLSSPGGVHARLADAGLHLDPLHITGENTDLHVQGSLNFKDKRQLDLAASGAINLKLAETLDPDLTASGTTTFQVEAHGPLRNPGLQGRIDFDNGSLSLEDLPNGLSQLHGTLEFNQNRLEVKTLTAMSGGGLLTVGGWLAYQHGLYANLSVSGKGIRIRYPQGVSSLADAAFHLEGSQSNLLLSGNVLITRFTASADLDIAALAAQANAVQPVTSPDAPSNHIRLDVHVVSSPQLNFQNAFAKLAGDVDLRLRGTLASPSLLGRVSVTQGNALIAGTRYELQRGDITFTNPVRIEPVIDLTATAHVEDYDITLGLHGTPSKLAVTYRSDPPMPEADVVSLLALGHTESQQRLYTQQQEQALANPTTDALLGGALNATVSSRVQKLFGAGSVKVDPNYLGAFGNSTSRITVQEQLGRNVVLTYATDVNTTGQQLLQAEVAINHHVSLVVARDESGVFSMVVKATRRYR